MRKLGKFLAVALCTISISLYACSPSVVGPPNPTFTPSASPTDTVLPSASPTPVPQYSYNLPLKVTSDMECNLGSSTLFEIKADGTFNYLSGPAGSEKTDSRMLSQSELTSVKALLSELDIARLAEKDTPVPAGTGQTADCRAIENYTMQVNSSTKTFDRNSRTLVHTSEYLAALDRLKSKLESLKSNYSYSLPLRVTSNNECSATAVNNITNEVKADGTYTFTTTENGTEKTVTRQLSDAELTSLKDLINDLDLARLAESDTAVPPGAPQTTDCRIIEDFILQVNGKERTFDRNGRQLIHSQEYLDALTKLKTRLEDLKNPSLAKYAYDLPLRITLNNECTTPAPDRIIYEVKSDGTFTYIKTENDLNQTATRKLTDTEINDLKAVLRDVDIARLAEGDQPVVPGSPQTLECRSIENYSVLVNGTAKTFDRNGRQLIHTQAYLDGLTKIKAKLVELAGK